VQIPLRQPRVTLPVPDSSTPQLGRGRLELDVLAREYTLDTLGGTRQQLRAVTIFLVNRRASTRRRYEDLSYAFQARIELGCLDGILPRHDLSGYRLDDEDVRIADLHYRDVAEFAVGRSTSAAWGPEADGKVMAAWTDPLPTPEVERVAPTREEKLPGITFGMEALAELAEKGSADLSAALSPLPDLYRAWIKIQHGLAITLERPRRETAEKLLAGMEVACARIAAGISLLRSDQDACRAFRFMNEAVATAARRRNAGPKGDPGAQPAPKWRPFQLAFILLNLASLVDKTHPDREAVDLLFFPTGVGKTEAYLGLAAFAIAHRRLTAGEAGAGVNDLLVLLAVLMIEAGGGLALAIGMALSGPPVERTPLAAAPEAARTSAADAHKTSYDDAYAAAPDASATSAGQCSPVRPLSSSARPLRTSDASAVVDWLHGRSGRAVVGMRRLASDLGCSASKAHDDVRRLVSEGVLRATPGSRGTLLELVSVGRPN
jgi:hypothetical protein